MEMDVKSNRQVRTRWFLFGAIAATFLMSYLRLFLWALQHGYRLSG